MFTGVPISKDKIKKLDEAYEFLNKFLDENEFVAGSNVTLADISIIASVTTMTVSID